MSTVKYISQTCKSILFEEFDPSRYVQRLNVLINLDTSPNSEDRNKFIDDSLIVHSFDEFIKKFAPTVYEYFFQNSEGNIKAYYTTDKKIADKNNGVPISIIDHSYYKMLVDAYNKKSVSGEANITFDTSSIKDILTPKNEIREAYNLRGKLKVLGKKYMLAVNNDEPTEFFEDKINETIEEISQTYKASVIKMLPITYDDTCKRLAVIEQKIEAIGSGDDSSNQLALKSGQLGFDENGNLKLIASPQFETQELSNKNDIKLLTASDVQDQISEAVESDYNNKVPEENRNEFTKSLVLSIYTEKAVAIQNENVTKDELEDMKSKLLARKNQYEEILAQAKNSFIQTLTSVVQKIIGVKIFFDHACKGDLKEGILITNCRVDDLISPTCIDNFKRFIEHRGLTEKDKKIWFAIIPQVLGNYNKSVSSNKPKGSFGSSKKSSSKSKTIEGADFNSLKTLLDILDKANIMSIFNFAPTVETTFAGIKAQYIEEIQKKLDTVNYKHASFAYPNFTLMPESLIYLSESKDADKKIKIPAVYIDSAYVAGGLLVASQQPLMLKKFDLKVDEDNACVHVKLEDDLIANNLTTHFNPEMAYTWDNDITKTISENPFGFVFCCDRKLNPYTKDYLKNTYILFARTLAKSDKNFIPIYQVLTKDFIVDYIKASLGSKITKELLRRELPNLVSPWKLESQKYKNNVNLILLENETVEYDEDQKKFRIILDAVEEILTDDDLGVID